MVKRSTLKMVVGLSLVLLIVPAMVLANVYPEQTDNFVVKGEAKTIGIETKSPCPVGQICPPKIIFDLTMIIANTDSDVLYLGPLAGVICSKDPNGGEKICVMRQGISLRYRIVTLDGKEVASGELKRIETQPLPLKIAIYPAPLCVPAHSEVAVGRATVGLDSLGPYVAYLFIMDGERNSLVGVGSIVIKR